MSERACPNCGETAAESAAFCAKCGTPLSNDQAVQAPASAWAPPPAAAAEEDKKKNQVGCAVVLVVVLLFIGVCSTMSSDDEGSSDIGAYVICKDFVSDRLKAPSGADFASYTDSTVTSTGADTYRVRSHVDAENSFGAKIRTDFTCEVRDNGDTWSLIDLSL